MTNQRWYDIPTYDELIKLYDFDAKDRNTMTHGGVNRELLDKTSSQLYKMINKGINLDFRPEFGIELALCVPYAYSLHLRGLLESVKTSIEMKPFYYFCDNVMEYYNKRTIDNELAGLHTCPNSWIHHNAIALKGVDYEQLSAEEKIEVNGVLDYTEWECPPFKEHFSNAFTTDTRKTVIITNKYNIEHGERPRGFFDIECLGKMFAMLTDKGYKVIYKRTRNTEKHFAYDENEIQSLNLGFTNIVAMDRTSWKPEMLTDFGLVESWKSKGVITMDDEVENIRYRANNFEMRYNEAQLRIMANATHYISVCGGNSILSALFGGTLVTYVHKGKELREGYFKDNSYIRKLSNANVIPVLDPIPDGGVNNYNGIYEAIRNNF